MNDLDERTSLAKERTSLAAERNRMANLRTYLSWLRTGLASVGGGLAIIRFANFQTHSHQLTSHIAGSLLVLLGISMFIHSCFDYKRSYKKLKIENGYSGSMPMIFIISFVLIILSITLLFISLINL